MVDGKAHILHLLQLNPKVRLVGCMTANYNSYRVKLVYHAILACGIDCSEEYVPVVYMLIFCFPIY